MTLTDATRIITTAAAITNACTTSIWNGGVYVESIAAAQFDTAGTSAAIRKARTHEMHNSGVRIINGRGKVPSTTATPGFTLATNDVVYILAASMRRPVSTPATVAVTVPAVPGDSTGHNYETGELPASVVADAVVLLSQPHLSSGSNQDTGWNDAFSGNYDDASATYSSSWATTAPSSTNESDGVNTSQVPYKIPFDASNGTLTGASSTLKLAPGFSEYSVAMLCGIVPTGKNGVTQNSGGLHNFPRFLEDWTSVECRIRGAMVALFECRVGNDPWSLRTYQPPVPASGASTCSSIPARCPRSRPRRSPSAAPWPTTSRRPPTTPS